MKTLCRKLSGNIVRTLCVIIISSGIGACGNSGPQPPTPNGQQIIANNSSTVGGAVGNTGNAGANAFANPTISPTGSQPIATVLPEGQAGQMMLPIGPIYDQGMANWCWAYSAFHALRTYYYDSQATDTATQSWRAAIKAIDSPDGLKKYISSTTGAFGGLTEKDPNEFITQFRQANNLPAQNWQTIDSSNATNTINQVVSNIRKMIPSIYCSADHCRMVYGFVSDGTRITKFAIADSAGSPSTYLEDVAGGNGRFAGVVTLVP